MRQGGGEGVQINGREDNGLLSKEAHLLPAFSKPNMIRKRSLFLLDL